MLDKLVAYKLTWSKKAVDASPVGSDPFMDVRFRHQSYPRAPSRIALLLQRMPKVAPFACFTGLAAQHQVVAGAQHFEVIEVIDNGNSLLLQLPQNRRR